MTKTISYSSAPPADETLFAFKEQHCFNCFVSNSEIDNYLMQCGKCHKFYYCGMQCFNAHLAVHLQYCQTGCIYYEPERYSGGSSNLKQGNQVKVAASVSIPAPPAKPVRQSSEESLPRRPSDRLWAAFHDSSSSSSSSSDDDDDSSVSSSEASIVESFVECIDEEGETDDKDSSWSDADDEATDDDEPETLLEVVEESDDDDDDNDTDNHIARQTTVQPVRAIQQAHSEALPPPTVMKGSGAAKTPNSFGQVVVTTKAQLDKEPDAKYATVVSDNDDDDDDDDEEEEEVHTGASGRGRFANDDDDYEEGYSIKGRGRVGGTEWEETEEISRRRGSAKIAQSATNDATKGRRHSIGVPTQAVKLDMALVRRRLKPIHKDGDQDWSSESGSDHAANNSRDEDKSHTGYQKGDVSTTSPSGRGSSKYNNNQRVINQTKEQQEQQGIRRQSDHGMQHIRHEMVMSRRLSLPQGQFQFLAGSEIDQSNENEDIELRHVDMKERSKPQFERPDWSRKAPLRTTSKGEKARNVGDLRKNRATKPEEGWAKPEWTRNAPLRTSSRGARLKAGNSLRMKRTGNGIQVLGGDPLPDRRAPARRSSKDGGLIVRTPSRKSLVRTPSNRSNKSLRLERKGSGTKVLGGDLLPNRRAPARRSSKDGSLIVRTPSRNAPARTSSSRSKKRNKKTGAPVIADNVRIENGQIMWEAPKLRSTARGSLLLRQQSIRNSKCVGALRANADAVKAMLGNDYDTDE